MHGSGDATQKSVVFGLQKVKPVGANEGAMNRLFLEQVADAGVEGLVHGGLDPVHHLFPVDEAFLVVFGVQYGVDDIGAPGFGFVRAMRFFKTDTTSSSTPFLRCTRSRPPSRRQ